MKRAANVGIQTAVNISAPNSSATGVPSGTVESNVLRGQRVKNRSELSLKSTIGNFAEEAVGSSSCHFAVENFEWPTVQILRSILWTAVRCEKICPVPGMSWKSEELSGTERQTAERCWQRDKTVHCFGRRLYNLAHWQHQKTTSWYIQIAKQCMVLTLHRTSGTAMFGTNSATYRWHSSVWNQQCTVRMAQQCIAPTVHRKDGTAVYGTNSAPYRWHSNV